MSIWRVVFVYLRKKCQHPNTGCFLMALKQYADNPQDTALQSLVSLLKQYQKELEPSKDLIDHMKRFLDWQIDFYHARGDEATAKTIQREILGEDGLVAYFMSRAGHA